MTFSGVVVSMIPAVVVEPIGVVVSSMIMLEVVVSAGVVVVGQLTLFFLI